MLYLLAPVLSLLMRDSHIWTLAIGSSLYVRQLFEGKVKGWSSDVIHLARITQSQPYAEYSAFTKGLASRWVYVSRTVPDVVTFMQSLEDTG